MALSTAPHPLSMAKVCWWHFCHPEGRTQPDNFFITSTHKTHTYSLMWRNQTKMDHFHSWTPRFHQVPTTPSSPQSTESPHIQISIYTGTAIISLQWNSVFNTLAHRVKVVSSNQQSLHKGTRTHKESFAGLPLPNMVTKQAATKFWVQTLHQQWTKFYGHSTQQQQ